MTATGTGTITYSSSNTSVATVTLKTTRLTSSNVKANAFKGIKSTCTFKDRALQPSTVQYKKG